MCLCSLMLSIVLVSLTKTVVKIHRKSVKSKNAHSDEDSERAFQVPPMMPVYVRLLSAREARLTGKVK